MERFLDFQFRKEIRLLPLFLNESFRSIASSLLYLFSSIYIYKTITLHLAGGRSPTPEVSRAALLSVFIFFFSLYGFKFISNLFAEELALGWGLKKQIWIGLSFLVLCLVILVLSLKRPLLLFLASPFWGLSIGFYWFGRHGLMVKTGHQKAFGKELGMVGLISTLLLSVVPFLGGALISLAGYQALFGVSLFFVLLAALAVKPIKDERTRHDTCLAEIFELFKTHKRMLLAYVGDTAGATIYAVAIPLYLFLILEKELTLGGFFTLSMILVALINLVIGRWVDLRGKRELIGFGSIASSLVWLGRMLSRRIGVLFVFDILDQITAGMTGIPLNVLTYEKALDGHSTGRAILFREVAIAGGQFLACGLLIFLAILGVGLQFSFLAAAFFSLWPLLILRGKRW